MACHTFIRRLMEVWPSDPDARAAFDSWETLYTYLSLSLSVCSSRSLLCFSLSVVRLLSRLRWSECVMFLLFTVRSTALKTLMGSWCGTWTSTPTSSITWPAAAMTVKSSSGMCVTSTSLSSVWRSTLTGQTQKYTPTHTNTAQEIWKCTLTLPVKYRKLE